MKILIVSSTLFEVKPLLNFLGIAMPSAGLNNANMDFDDKEIQVLITGVGMVNTALMLGRYLNSSWDLVLNVGVCGTFNKSFELGKLVLVNQDIISELGAEDGDDFLTYDKLELPGDFIFSENNHIAHPIFNSLTKAKGITVNKVHGNDLSIEKIVRLFNPDIESMEGAAFFAACKGICHNYMQIRAISNYVERRDKSKWQMSLAIENLNAFLINFIKDKTNK
jgi:futalosine hydrolase